MSLLETSNAAIDACKGDTSDTKLCPSANDAAIDRM